MKKEELDKLLGELAESSVEPVRAGLAEEIKQQIPHVLTPVSKGRDRVNIIIDLRINKLAAAAVIIITMILLAGVLRPGGVGEGGLYQDGKMLVKHVLGRGGVDGSQYQHLAAPHKESAFYGGDIDMDDSESILMQWKLEDGRYKVIFADSRVRTVEADEMIRLLSRMLEKREK